MGAWGVHSFENDDAKSWCQAYREMGLSVAGSTLDVALSDFQNGILNASIACRAVAAVEAVAYVLGRGSAEAMEAFQGAPEADPETAKPLIEKCNKAILAITGGSELAELWKATSDYDAWAASLNALQTRVNGTRAEQEEQSEAPRDELEHVEARVDSSHQDQLNDIRNAISSLEADVALMRQEMREGLIALAKRIAGREQ